MQCRVSCFANYFFRLMRRAFGNQSIPSAFAIFARTRANFRFTLPTSRMPNPLLASSSFIVLALSREPSPTFARMIHYVSDSISRMLNPSLVRC
jgi:hypothetical protein